MSDLIEHLVRNEGLDNIGWLSLFNEPDSLYYHDSPLYERLFPDGTHGKRSWSVIVPLCIKELYYEKRQIKRTPSPGGREYVP